MGEIKISETNFGKIIILVNDDDDDDDNTIRYIICTEKLTAKLPV